MWEAKTAKLWLFVDENLSLEELLLVDETPSRKFCVVRKFELAVEISSWNLDGPFRHIHVVDDESRTGDALTIYNFEFHFI